ncbi:MAG: hypothetical protein WBA12_02510, partial [Catalinimonas sp.]
MEIKLDQQALATYASKFTAQMAQPAFLHRDFLNGDQILEFCSVRQVNLFLLKGLFDRWQEEATRMRSPYFDYEHEEVQQSMGEFMNTLSRHIAVRQRDFEPLLERAVIDTLRLAMTPLTYFHELIDVRNERFVHADTLKELSRYLIYNKVLVQEVISELQSSYSKQVPPGEAKLYFYKAHSYHGRALTPAADVLKHFSELLPVPADQFREPSQAQESFFARLPTVDEQPPAPERPQPPAAVSAAPEPPPTPVVEEAPHTEA